MFIPVQLSVKRFGLETSSPPQFGQILFIFVVQSVQKVHS